jgi:acyl carrier protein
MTRKKIEDFINKTLITGCEFEVEADKIKPSTSLRSKEGLHIDADGISNLAMYLEEEYNIRIPEAIEDRWHTIKDVVDYIEAKVIK